MRSAIEILSKYYAKNFAKTKKDLVNKENYPNLKYSSASEFYTKLLLHRTEPYTWIFGVLLYSVYRTVLGTFVNRDPYRF